MDFADLVRTLTQPRFAVFHFLVLGGVLFALEKNVWKEPGEATWNLAAAASPPTGSKSEVDDELLYREALRRGLDRDDSVVRQRLVRDMKFLEPESTAPDADLYRRAIDLGLDREDLVVRRRMIERARRQLIGETPIFAPSPAQLAVLLEEQADRLRLPARVRLEQVHFDNAERAAAVLESLRAGMISVDELKADPLPLSRSMPSLSARELAGRLGPDFARRAFEIEPGSWTGPVPSSYGSSLVFVHEVVPPRMPEVAEVRERLEGEWLAQREAQALETALVGLRKRAGVERDAPSPGEKALPSK